MSDTCGVLSRVSAPSILVGFRKFPYQSPSIQNTPFRLLMPRFIRTLPHLNIDNYVVAGLLHRTSIGRNGIAEARQYSSASMIVMTRSVTAGSDGSGEWYVRLLSK